MASISSFEMAHLVKFFFPIILNKYHKEKKMGITKQNGKKRILAMVCVCNTLKYCIPKINIPWTLGEHLFQECSTRRALP